MGITLHYSGNLRNYADIDPLIAETIDISKSMKWEYDIIEPKHDMPVKGIVIIPENCDPLWLTFHARGFICNPVLISFMMEVDPKHITSKEAEFWLCTRTQDAGFETHIKLISLLRYLGGKYLSRLEVHDDSEFWETNDEAICRRYFERSKKDINKEITEFEEFHPVFGNVVVKRMRNMKLRDFRRKRKPRG